MDTTVKNMAVVGLIGFAVWECRKAYTDMAPSLHELRTATSLGSVTRYRQALLDTDICIGSVVVLAGIAASVLMRSVIPIALLFGTFGILSVYHHLVLGS